jgi:hypothetical protein
MTKRESPSGGFSPPLRMVFLPSPPSIVTTGFGNSCFRADFLRNCLPFEWLVSPEPRCSTMPPDERRIFHARSTFHGTGSPSAWGKCRWVRWSCSDGADRRPRLQFADRRKRSRPPTPKLPPCATPRAPTATTACPVATVRDPGTLCDVCRCDSAGPHRPRRLWRPRPENRRPWQRRRPLCGGSPQSPHRGPWRHSGRGVRPVCSPTFLRRGVAGPVECR